MPLNANQLPNQPSCQKRDKSKRRLRNLRQHARPYSRLHVADDHEQNQAIDLCLHGQLTLCIYHVDVRYWHAFNFTAFLQDLCQTAMALAYSTCPLISVDAKRTLGLQGRCIASGDKRNRARKGNTMRCCALQSEAR